MPKKTFTPEQIVVKPRHIEVLVSQGKTVPLACKDSGIIDHAYYRWRREYGGLQIEKAKLLKDRRICRRKMPSSNGRWRRSHWKSKC